MSSSEETDWSLKQIVASATGTRITQYFYKGRKCKRIQLEGHLARQAAGYTLIEKDLRSVQAWLRRIEELHPQPEGRPDYERYYKRTDSEVADLVKGLFVASLTFYGKCFTRCSGRRVKLERRQLEDNFRGTHDDFMRYRHSFAAHSGADNFEHAKVAIALPPRKRTPRLPKIYTELTQPDAVAISSDSELGFLQLVQHVHAIACEKRNAVLQKIWRDDVLAKGAEYWYAR